MRDKSSFTVLSLLALLLSILSPISFTQATAAPALVTCVNLQTGTERISHTGKCRYTQEAQANWHKNQSDSLIASGATAKVITVCSNKESSPVSYQVIRAKCARHQVTTIFSRSGALPAKPAIAQVVSFGHDSSQISLAQNPEANPDAPIAFYTITSSKGNTQKVYYWKDLSLVISGLQAQTTYTFTVSATTADGTSPVSASSLPVTTPAFVPPPPISTTTVKVSCANGGVCVVGDRGPGGGIVFYVSASNFTSAGSTCNTTCKYLEVAPATWQGAGVADDSLYVWSSNVSAPTGQDTVTASTEGIASNSANEKFNWKIGQGFYNTSVMKVAGATSAAQAAVLGYAGNVAAGQWFIPSMNELNELCKYVGGQTTGDVRVACITGGTFKSTANAGTDLGGFFAGYYWSSTEQGDSVSAWGLSLANGIRGDRSKNGANPIRPIRAF